MAKQEYILKVVLDDGELKVKIPGVVKSTNDLSKAFDKASTSSKKFAQATKENKKVNEDLISNAGLAGATLTELGRTISDLPFGIRGVANNLSQLSTLFITLVAKSADGGKSITGVAKAFQLLKNQLSGPLGIILIFQAVIAALDFFSQKSKKAADAADLFTDSADRQASTLQVLLTRIKDTNLALEDREALLKASAVSSSKLSKILDDETLSLEERNKRSERFLELELERIQRQALIEKAEEDLALARQRSEKAIESENKGLKDFVFIANKATTSADIQAAQTKFLNDKKKESKDATDAISAAETALATLIIGNSQIIQEQSDLLESNTKAKKDNAKAKFLIDPEDIALSLGIELAFDKLKQRREEEKILRDREIQGNKLELAIKIANLSKLNLSREQFEKRKKELIDQAKQKEIDYIKSVLKTDTLTTEERISLATRMYKLISELAGEAGEEGGKGFEKIIEAAKEASKFLKFGIDAISKSIDAEISQEERKTMLINNELKKRIINEKLTADQKEAINNQIEKNEVALQEKRDKLAERQFKLQKAVSISQALIGTAEMAVDAFGTIKGMKFLGPAALPLAIAAAATATAFGLKQVDAIRKTQFVPSAAPGSTRVSGLGGAGATGGGRQDPTFNIVGTGQQFQLSQAIAQRTGEPVKAYVVTGDVRSGLALERNIIKGSKLG